MIRPWSYQWGYGLIFGESINIHYAAKMPNLYILHFCIPERNNISEYCHMLRLIFHEYDAHKVF